MINSPENMKEFISLNSFCTNTLSPYFLTADWLIMSSMLSWSEGGGGVSGHNIYHCNDEHEINFKKFIQFNFSTKIGVD